MDFFQFPTAKFTHMVSIDSGVLLKVPDDGSEPGTMWLGSRLLTTQPRLLFISFVMFFTAR